MRLKSLEVLSVIGILPLSKRKNIMISARYARLFALDVGYYMAC